MGVAYALLACPGCGAGLDRSLRCAGCGGSYAAPDGIPDLRADEVGVTADVRRFYEAAPFPGYPPGDSLDSLRARAGRSAFLQRLDRELPLDVAIVEIGCGTGQTSLFLARGARTVVGVDLTQASLVLAAAAAKRYGVTQATFVGSNLLRPGLKAESFDVVYCSGVVHHTRAPRQAFRQIVRLARPGGIVVLGVYNVFARLPLRLRRLIARATGYRIIPFDPVLRDRVLEPERHRAWLRDQYQHPEEHTHSIAEVQRWFAENGVDYLRCCPSALIGGEDGPLLEAAPDNWGFENLLAQIGWMATLGAEGGLFIVIGRKRHGGAT
jgi:SAM-dependent methyltransferase